MAITQHETTSTYTGLSTDTKPIDVNNGTAFLEMDTGTIYFYDSGSEEWLEWSSSSGGSSGGSSLPDVTTNDNGDVLTVVEGAWAKAAPSGGGANIIVCYLSFDPETGVTQLVLPSGSYLTYNMIINSDAALIMLIAVQENAVGYYPLTSASHEYDQETGDSRYLAFFGPYDTGYGAVAYFDPDNPLVILD